MVPIETIAQLEYPREVQIKTESAFERTIEVARFLRSKTKQKTTEKKIDIRIFQIKEEELSGPIVVKPSADPRYPHSNPSTDCILVATPKGQVAELQGEAWMNVTDSFTILEQAGKIADNLIPIVRESLGLPSPKYSWMNEKFYRIICSESGKILSLIPRGESVFPLSLYDPVENIQTLYPPLTSMLKQKEYSILGITGTRAEVEAFLSAKTVDPKIEILRE